ncbi:MAG: bacteriohemerythrin [Clostridiales bacterium]|jgi:hemerythrin-like metal-binding protein|nr:bacteriohemerythrin [Clostridiales bacterium]
MWKDSYAIGHELIDSQHRRLFDYAENLMSTLGQQLEFEEYKRQIVETLGFLKKYTIEHFKDEEEYQREVNYEGYEAHKKLHAKLIQDVLRHEKELVESEFKPEAVKSFLGFLLTWLVYHVAGEDQKITGGVAQTAVAGLDLVHAFAQKAGQVIRTITGITEDEIKPEFDSSKHLGEGISFKVGLVGSKDKNGIALVYSHIIALGTLKAMTGMEVNEINEIAYSALQEMSNILSAKMVDVVAKADGKFVDIDYPIRAEIKEIPKGSDSFLMCTSIGDMEIIIY